MSYWVFKGKPVVKRPFKSLADARKSAIAYLKRTKNDYVAIVKSDSEPYEYRTDYKMVGIVVNHGNYDVSQKGMFDWYVDDSAKYITPSGSLGMTIPKNKRVWD